VIQYFRPPEEDEDEDRLCFRMMVDVDGELGDHAEAGAGAFHSEEEVVFVGGGNRGNLSHA